MVKDCTKDAQVDIIKTVYDRESTPKNDTGPVSLGKAFTQMGWAPSILTFHIYIASASSMFVYQGLFLWKLCLACGAGVGTGFHPVSLLTALFHLESGLESLFSSAGTCLDSGSRGEGKAARTGSSDSAPILAAAEMGRGKLLGIRSLTI